MTTRFEDDLVHLAHEVRDAELASRARAGEEDIMVANLSTGDYERLQSHSSDSCLTPTWAPDGKPLLLTPDPGSSTSAIRWNDIKSDKAAAPLETIAERSGSLCPVFPVARSDGDYDLYYSTDDPFRLRYLEPDGSFHDVEGAGELRGDGADGDWTEIAAVGHDGGRMCLTAPHEADDELPYLRCDAVIDPDTGRVLRDRRKDPATQVLFLPDGEAVSRTAEGTVERLDTDGEVVARTREDPQWRGHRLLAYVPD